MADNGELKRSNVKPSGRSSIIKGAKYQRGFIIRPEQMLALLHDTQPSIPIPRDAEFKGLGLQDEGSSSTIEFYYTSKYSPTQCCLALKPDLFFHMLVDLSMGMLPMDSELDGIEVSQRFTVILLRVKSSHWPPTMTTTLPLYHLGYEAGRMLLVDPSKAIETERRIRIN